MDAIGADTVYFCLQEKQSILQSLVKRQVLYDDSISIDSVIAWSEQLLSTQQSNEDRTTYFLLQLQLANAYTLRGDISLATNRAQLMYEEAKATDYQFGMVVANQAIGDAYNTIANMGDKALESYQDALTELSNISDQHPYRAQLLLKMSNVLQRKGRLEEAEKILEELEKILYQEPDYPTDFFFCIEKTNFAISHGHLSQDYLDEANIWLHKMDSIYQLHPEKFYRFHLDYTTAAYYRAMGNWDKQYWKQALDIYSKLQAEYSGNKRSTYYRWTSLEKIYLCKIQGMAMEACRIYQELYPPIDTLASQSYIRQINTIKAKYQVDKAETASNNEYNKIITSILVGTMALVTLFVLLAILLKRQREKVKLSTQKLATSRVSRYLVGRTLFRFANYPVLCGMENEYLNMLARIVLPAQILDYFTIAGVSQTSTEIHISLDEKMSSELSSKVHFESKGFMEPVSVTDFPIRDHKVILRIRRRRWTDLRTGKSFSLPIDLDVVAKGTRYSKEFGAFLKETYGDIPRDLPYA